MNRDISAEFETQREILNISRGLIGDAKLALVAARAVKGSTREAYDRRAELIGRSQGLAEASISLSCWFRERRLRTGQAVR